MASLRLSLATRLTLGLTLAQAISLGAQDAAQAQFFFQPFGYSYRYDVPPPPPYDEERPRFATPRAVSRILARRGFELVSGLGRRGDQLVVTGVSRRDGTYRFFIDPYEGQVIHAVRLAPPADGSQPFDGPSAGPPRDLGAQPPEMLAPRRSARPVGEPPPAGARPVQPNPPVAKAPTAPSPSPSAPEKPREAAKPVEWVKPEEIAKPQEPAKVETPKTEAPKTEAPKPEPSKADPPKTEAPKPEVSRPEPTNSEPAKPDPAKPADVKADDTKSREPATGDATRPGVPGRRAIVAPKGPEAPPATH